MHICTHACVCIRLLWRNTILLRLLCFYLVFSLLGEAFKRQKGAHSIFNSSTKNSIRARGEGAASREEGQPGSLGETVPSARHVGGSGTVFREARSRRCHRGGS